MKINKSIRAIQIIGILSCYLCYSVHAQALITTPGVFPTDDADPSAILEVRSFQMGVRLPSMTKAQRDAISSPAAGLTIFCSDCGGKGELNVYTGTWWLNMAGWPASDAPLLLPPVAEQLQVGDVMGGGTIGYLLQPGDPGYDPAIQHGFIVAPFEFEAEWGCAAKPFFTPSDETIGAGLSNSLEIADSCGLVSSAAGQCILLFFDGQSDWFLPNAQEFNKIFANKSVIGGQPMDAAYYWTSSWQGFNIKAYRTSDNQIINRWYDNISGVRPIRMF